MTRRRSARPQRDATPRAERAPPDARRSARSAREPDTSEHMSRLRGVDYGSDEEQYNYNDEDQNDEGEDDKIAIENAYYEGDDLKNENPQQACALFERESLNWKAATATR